jgi:hypothetical protein
MITLQELYDVGLDSDEIEDAYKKERDEDSQE